MKVRPAVGKTILILIALVILGAGIIFSFTFNLFLKPITEWGWQQWTIIGVWAVTSASLFLATFFTSYYVVYRKYVQVKKGTKTLIYYYSDVVYIDEAQYKKNRTIAFFTNQGHSRYLMGDKKDILFQTMVQNCKNRLTTEEFRQKYPKVKL